MARRRRKAWGAANLRADFEASCASLAWAVGAALACRRVLAVAAMRKVAREPGRPHRARRPGYRRGWRGDEWCGFVARDGARRRRKACARRLFSPLAAGGTCARCNRCPAECDARGPRTWEAGLRLRRALRAHGAIEGARQLCDSLHRYARTSGRLFFTARMSARPCHGRDAERRALAWTPAALRSPRRACALSATAT